MDPPLIQLIVQESSADEKLFWADEAFDLNEMRNIEREVHSLIKPEVDGFEPIYMAIYSL